MEEYQVAAKCHPKVQMSLQNPHEDVCYVYMYRK